MSDRKRTGRDNEKTKITKSYKGQQIVEYNNRPRPEETRHTQKAKKNLKILIILTFL